MITPHRTGSTNDQAAVAATPNVGLEDLIALAEDLRRTLLDGAGRLPSCPLLSSSNAVRPVPRQPDHGVLLELWANVGLGFQFTTYGLTEEMKTAYGNSPKSFVVSCIFGLWETWRAHACHARSLIGGL